LFQLVIACNLAVRQTNRHRHCTCRKDVAGATHPDLHRFRQLSTLTRVLK